MKPLGLLLAAGAAVLVVLGLQARAASPAVVMPAPQATPRPWYDQALGFLGTVAGNALGSWASLSRNGTAVPVKSATPSGAPNQASYPGYSNTSNLSIEDSIKAGLR